MRWFIPLFLLCIVSAEAWAQSRRDRSSDRSSDRRSGSSSSSASPVADDPNASKTGYERYTILSEHNIFVKNRVQRSRGPTTRDTSREPQRRPEQAFVLTGCVIENENMYAAFVENAQSGATTRVTVGENIATGKVVEIGFDYLEYETGGQRTRVEIGHNFTGAAVSTSTYVNSFPTTGPTTGPVDLANLSVEERMRRRRALGQ
jgi:hypothetical protein